MNASSPSPRDRRAAAAPAEAGVAVVTDTTTYVPAAMLDELGVSRVSLYVGWNDEMRREDTYDDLDAFYAKLREGGRLPTTSQPSVGDFKAHYEPLLDAGHEIVSVHIASGLSGTCESALEAKRALAAEGHAGRIEVVDAQTGAGGLGCMVLAAARAAREGATVDEVARAARDVRERLQLWFCLDTLEYLRRGGRIGAAQALLGTALKIKPILTFGTEIAPVDKVRTRARALTRMEGYLRELHEREATGWIVQHAQSQEDADRLVEVGTKIFGSGPLFCTQVGPVLGAHLGSGILVGGLTREPSDDPEPSL